MIFRSDAFVQDFQSYACVQDFQSFAYVRDYIHFQMHVCSIKLLFIYGNWVAAAGTSDSWMPWAGIWVTVAGSWEAARWYLDAICWSLYGSC
jgi:hypothetical protein